MNRETFFRIRKSGEFIHKKQNGERKDRCTSYWKLSTLKL